VHYAYDYLINNNIMLVYA
jgi:hypothetical protein